MIDATNGLKNDHQVKQTSQKNQKNIVNIVLIVGLDCRSSWQVKPHHGVMFCIGHWVAALPSLLTSSPDTCFLASGNLLFVTITYTCVLFQVCLYSDLDFY